MDRRKAIVLFGAGIGGAVGLKYGYDFLKVKQPRDLTKIDEYRSLLSELTETIIPETDTPGAKSAGVADFVIVMYTDVLSSASANNFINGLSDLEQYSFDGFGRSFVECDAEERHKIIAYFKPNSTFNFSLIKKIKSRFLGVSFYDTLLDLTTVGFCSSQQGATQFLNYDFIPAEYQGCIPLRENQKAWATN